MTQISSTSSLCNKTCFSSHSSSFNSSSIRRNSKLLVAVAVRIIIVIIFLITMLRHKQPTVTRVACLLTLLKWIAVHTSRRQMTLLQQMVVGLPARQQSLDDGGSETAFNKYRTSWHSKDTEKNGKISSMRCRRVWIF